MSKIVLDIYITFAVPLSVFAFISLGVAIRRFRERDRAAGMLFVSIAVAVLVGIVVFILLGYGTKLWLGVLFYRVMTFVSFAGFVVAAFATYYRMLDLDGKDLIRTAEPRIQVQLLLAAFILSMFIATAAMLHFTHEAGNAHHAICPQCDDSTRD